MGADRSGSGTDLGGACCGGARPDGAGAAGARGIVDPGQPWRDRGHAFALAAGAVAGSASTVGARKLAGMAQALERECLQGSPMEAAARIADFSELLSETAATLRAMLPREKDSAAA